MIKSVLTLAHGNADVERSLSDNRNTVNPERTDLGIHTINGLRMAKDEVNQMNEVHHLNLSSKQIRLVKRAKQVYSERLRKEKEESDKVKRELLGKKQEKEMIQKEREKTKKFNESLDIQNTGETEIQEKTLAAEEKEFSNMLKSAEVLLKQATTKLSMDLKEKDVIETQVAQGMLESAESRMEKGRRGTEDCQQKRQDLNKKRFAIMDKTALKSSLASAESLKTHLFSLN